MRGTHCAVRGEQIVAHHEGLVARQFRIVLPRSRYAWYKIGKVNTFHKTALLYLHSVHSLFNLQFIHFYEILPRVTKVWLYNNHSFYELNGIHRISETKMPLRSAKLDLK